MSVAVSAKQGWWLSAAGAVAITNLQGLANDSPSPVGRERAGVRVTGVQKARQGWHLCSRTIPVAVELRQERHHLEIGAEYVAPTELELIWATNFKDVAPLALGRSPATIQK
jgi:hypothetical protein